MSKGIDYGMGQTNIDKATGIRFGVVPVHALAHWALDEFQADYGAPTCPKCGNAARDLSESNDGTGQVETDAPDIADYVRERGACEDYACDDCRYVFDSSDAFGDEPISHNLDADGYIAQLDAYNDVFILKSPYFTRAQFCSPCAPGAVHLDNPVEDGERGYCFGHDWFEEGKAPYPVYSVKTGELIPAPVA